MRHRRDPASCGIKQHAIGLNFIDTYFRSGLYKAPSMPFIVGNEGRRRSHRGRPGA